MAITDSEFPRVTYNAHIYKLFGKFLRLPLLVLIEEWHTEEVFASWSSGAFTYASGATPAQALRSLCKTLENDYEEMTIDMQNGIEYGVWMMEWYEALQQIMEVAP